MSAESAADRIHAALEAMRETALVSLRESVGTIEEAIMALIEERLHEHGRAEAERAAHKIAGTAGMFGFHRATEVAQRLEQYFSRGATMAGATKAAALVEELHASLAREGTAEAEGTARDGATRPQRGGQPASTGHPVDGPLVVLTGTSRTFAAGLATQIRARGLVSEMVEAAHFATALEANEVPAAALVDLTDEETADGHEVLQTLSRRQVPAVVLLPEHASTARRLAALSAGASLLLDRPQETPEGCSRVADALAGLVRSRTAESHRILVVDDDETLLLAVRDILLATTAAEVVTLSDPGLFWSELNRVEPDLVLLDIDMPDIGGLELCRLLRSDAKWQHVPVVFLSARSGASMVSQVYAAGADDFVAKPVVGPELQARVSNRLQRTRLLQLIAETDPLTGVANRRHFEGEMERLHRLAERYEAGLSVGLVEISEFREFIDGHGHAAGDELLRHLAAHLRDAFRGHDVVARLDGEQFIVAMLGIARNEAAERLASVLGAFDVSHLVGHDLPHVGAKGAVAQHGPDGTDFEGLYRAAEKALRVARTDDRGRLAMAGASGLLGDGGPDIAIVEDDEVLAELLRHTLTTVGYRCTVLSNGIEAVDRLTELGAPLRPRAVLLDIDLPGRNGFEVLEALVRAGVTSRTVVIVLTARSSEDEAMHALRSGATDHIAKPFSVAVLVEKLHRLVSEAR